MKKFFKQIYNKIIKFDNYTKEYLKVSNNIEIPSIAYTNWGMYFADNKDFKSAIEKLETACTMSGQNPKPCLSLGIIYAKLKEYDKAEEALNEALKRDSRNAYTYSVLSGIYIAKKQFKDAENMLKKALKLSPEDYELHLNYGIFYAKIQKKEKAVEMLRKSKYLNPSNSHTYFILGVMLFELDKISEAFSEFKQLEKINPNYKNLNYYIALCYKKEKNYSAVLEYAQRALNEDDLNPSVYILLAQNYFDMNNTQEAIKVYEAGLKKGIKDFEYFLSWGITLLRINKYDDAKTDILKALEIRPNDSIALHRLGYCYFKEHNFDKAEELFNKSIEQNPVNSIAIADLGILYYEKKNYDKAISTFFKSIDISIENAYLYFYIANCYYKLNRLKKACEFYEKTIEYYHNHLEAYINYTMCLLALNNFKEASRKIRTAYQINRKSEKVILIYALTDLKSGICSDAIEKSDILLGINPNNKEAKIIKAQALISIRKAPEALDILYSLPEEEKNSYIFIYLSYLAYKVLVEDNPSNYNENMLNQFNEKLQEINSLNLNNEELSDVIGKTLDINKG